MSHPTHTPHVHEHNDTCGHTKIHHDGHTDFLHDGHMHHPHDDHVDEHVLPVSGQNPEICTPTHTCGGHDASHTHGPDCGHEAVPHGDHTDFLVNGHLHFAHDTHCDDHGLVTVG